MQSVGSRQCRPALTVAGWFVPVSLVATVFWNGAPLGAQIRTQPRADEIQIRAVRSKLRFRAPIAAKAEKTVGRDRVTVTVPLDGRDPATLSVYRVKPDQIEVLRPKATPEAVSLELSAGEMQYIKSKPPPHDAAALSRKYPAQHLGRLFFGVHREGGGVDARMWDLVLAAESPPAVWDAEKGGYAMRLVVGLQPAEEDAGEGAHGPAEVNLPQPITVMFERRNAELDPNRASIARTGFDGFQPVDFLCRRRDIPPTITARSDFGETPPLKVEITPRCADFEFDAPSRRILGLGLGTVDIGVAPLAEDGQPLVIDDPLDVAIEAERGILSSATVTIPARAKRGAVTLRSSGLGEVRVRASGAGVTSEPLVLTFVFPWAIGVATLIFGGCGGLLRSASERRVARRRGGRSRRRPPAWWSCSLEGAAVGLIAVLVALLGVRFSALPVSVVATEAGAGVIAVFAGFGGIGFFVFLRRLVLREKAAGGKEDGEPGR